MSNSIAVKKRLDELATEVAQATSDLDSGRITEKAFTATVDKAWTERQELLGTQKAHQFAQLLSVGAAASDGAPFVRGLRAKGAQVCPLHFDETELKAMHEAVSHRSSFAIRTKAFSSAESALPAQLQPFVVGPQYEGRLLDHLPVEPIEAPSLEYIVHTSTTGAPAIVAEGAVKPELVFNTEPLTATPQKIAAHTATSWEMISDWSRFVSYVQQELTRQVINVENAELISGAGTTGHLHGFLSTSGILTHDASADTGTNVTALDSVEMSIAQLRTGAALAEANLLVLHPNTFSAIRRLKNTLGNFLIGDPTEQGSKELFGVPVLPTTQIAAGKGLLLDTNKFGFVVVREAVSLRSGTNDDDFTRNLVRWVSEERLELAVERPAAVLSISGLPTS